MHFETGKHNFTFSFESDDNEVHLEMNCKELYLGDVLERFNEFLSGCGYVIDGYIDVVPHETSRNDSDEQPNLYKDKLMQNQTQDKFSMDHLPNNGWPFGGLTSASIPSLTTADIAPLTVTDLSTNKIHSYSDWNKVSQYPTMSPLTTEQVYSWSADLPSNSGEKIKVQF